MIQIAKIYRRKLIPDKFELLKDDIIIAQDNDTLITKWETLHPKTSFTHGSSCYFLNKGFKVSKFYRSDNSLLYWYCDIAEYIINPEEQSLTMTDLLADVVIYPDGRTEIVDLDELADALEQNLITKKQMTSCLHSLNHLLSYLYQSKLNILQAPLEHLGL